MPRAATPGVVVPVYNEERALPGSIATRRRSATISRANARLGPRADPVDELDQEVDQPA